MGTPTERERKECDCFLEGPCRRRMWAVSWITWAAEGTEDTRLRVDRKSLYAESADNAESDTVIKVLTCQPSDLGTAEQQLRPLPFRPSPQPSPRSIGERELSFGRA